ncbi:LysR substrate-binding domain-containing protein [Solilutibacter silvestris]|uniref:LysR family transcriptional regulator n=1 Tax=Solilutibacter silvestris TaxID=1645665 RepID=UPI003D337596
MNRIGDLDLFLHVLDQGSITAAARSLDLSVAVASQRLKRLENELGVRLFHRTTRRLHPTPEGLALAQQGRPLVEELESLGASLREGAREVSGTLRVTLSATFGRQYVSPLLPEFMARHPKLRLRTHLTDQSVDLVSEGYDLAIRIGALEDSSLVARRIASNRRVVCASSDYLARHGEPRTPQELADHDCLLLFGRDGPHDLWRFTAPDGADFAVRVHGRFESDLGEFIRDAALAGQGIATFSLWHVIDDLRAGRMQVILPDYRLPATSINAVTPHRRTTPPRVRAFVDFLSEKFGDVPPWER